ncbi:type II toxin-antitoxin system RelE/ParE family toxin [Clostridium perfringens]
MTSTAIMHLSEISVCYANNVTKDKVKEVILCITDNLNILKEFLTIGRAIPYVEEYRGYLCYKNYIAIYKVENDVIYVYGIFNCKQDYTSILKNILPKKETE